MRMKVQHRREYTPILRLLRQMRESKGFTQEKLGERLKWQKSAVQKSESGDRRVDFCEFVLWAHACGADPRKALDEYLAAIPPEEHAKTPPTGQFPWEVRDEPLRERDEKLVGLLSEASSLLQEKPKTAKPKRKSQK